MTNTINCITFNLLYTEAKYLNLVAKYSANIRIAYIAYLATGKLELNQGNVF